MRDGGRLEAFSYLTADKADAYRAVMRIFLDAKERFLLHLRPTDVQDALEAGVELDGVQPLLTQLVEWGNLRADPDTAEVATVEEFYRARFLYQLTSEGEAAERAVARFEELLVTPGELQTTALADIGGLLRELLLLARADDLDDARVHLTLRLLVGHALDDDRATTTLVLKGLQRRSSGGAGRGPLPTGEDRRALWAEAGVLREELAAPVLVLNLPADGDSLCDQTLRAHARTGEPARLTLRQLVRQPPRLTPLRAATVHVCENPAVVSAAAEQLAERSRPLVCVEGQPSSAAQTLLRRLREAGAELRGNATLTNPVGLPADLRGRRDVDPLAGGQRLA